MTRFEKMIDGKCLRCERELWITKTVEQANRTDFVFKECRICGFKSEKEFFNLKQRLHIYEILRTSF
jgi:transcription elongation factor Elf1